MGTDDFGGQICTRGILSPSVAQGGLYMGLGLGLADMGRGSRHGKGIRCKEGGL